MLCLVTAGPTYEPLDRVRRLTNFSTGELGSRLAHHLAACGHDVTLLRGEMATWRAPGGSESDAPARAGNATAPGTLRLATFSTAADLRDQLRSHAGGRVDAVFHAAAVSDFTFGQAWRRGPAGELTPLTAGKLSTREGSLLVELVPTPKIILELRRWFPRALLVGWKFEVDGDRAGVLEKAAAQMAASQSDACVANGPAYGAGFGVVLAGGATRHCAGHAELFAALEALLRRKLTAQGALD